MKIITKVSKLIINASVTTLILVAAPSFAQGIYYGPVYDVHCGPCYRHHVHHHRYHHKYHRRIVHYLPCDNEGYTVWYAEPQCPCAMSWEATQCASCGIWHPTGWQPLDEGYYYTTPDNSYQPGYDPDLSTGDDDASRHPEMDIDN